MEPNVFIYGLCDPRTGHLRYIGKAKNAKVRLYRHHCPGSKKNHRTDWLLNLKRNGLKPDMFIIEEVPDSQWEDAEQFWICYFKGIGCPLVNATSGGDGVHGVTNETRAKLRSIALSRPKPSLETRRKMSKVHTGNKYRLGQPSSFKGKQRSEQFGRRVSDALKGRKLSDRHKDNIRAGMHRFENSPRYADYREKMSSRIRKWWQSRRNGDNQLTFDTMVNETARHNEKHNNQHYRAAQT